MNLFIVSELLAYALFDPNGPVNYFVFFCHYTSYHTQYFIFYVFFVLVEKKLQTVLSRFSSLQF
jgi:hypothetical protein